MCPCFRAGFQFVTFFRPNSTQKNICVYKFSSSRSLFSNLHTMSTLRLVGLVAPILAAVAPPVVAGAWSPYKPSGMEYKLMTGVQTFSNAKAICSGQGTDASLASPATSDAAQFLYSLSSSETWLGLHNDLTERPKPCRDHAVFNWDSGLVCDIQPLSQIFRPFFVLLASVCSCNQRVATHWWRNPALHAPTCGQSRTHNLPATTRHKQSIAIQTETHAEYLKFIVLTNFASLPLPKNNIWRLYTAFRRKFCRLAFWWTKQQAVRATFFCGLFVFYTPISSSSFVHRDKVKTQNLFSLSFSIPLFNSFVLTLTVRSGGL